MAVHGVDSQSWIDFDGEKSTTRVVVTPLTAANFDAQGTLSSAYHIAVANITLGNLVKNVVATEDTQLGTAPDDPEAQREKKWLVQYHDADNGNKYSCELPCADLSLLDINDRKHAAIGDGDVVDAFVAAFEAYVKSPFDPANAVVVDEITYVGRRL